MSDFKDNGAAMALRLRVLLADGSSDDLESLRRELTRLPFIELVGETTSSAEAIEFFFVSRPDVVVAAIHLPEEGGFEVLRVVKRAATECVVILTSRLPTHFVQEAAGLLGAALVCPSSDGGAQLRLTLQNLSKQKSRQISSGTSQNVSLDT